MESGIDHRFYFDLPSIAAVWFFMSNLWVGGREGGGPSDKKVTGRGKSDASYSALDKMSVPSKKYFPEDGGDI